MTALQGRSNFWAGAPQSFNPHKLPADATCTCSKELVGMGWGEMVGRGRAGESLKPHNFSQLGNRGSPAGFSLRFSLITAACYSSCPYILFEIHISKDAKKDTKQLYLIGPYLYYHL